MGRWRSGRRLRKLQKSLWRKYAAWRFGSDEPRALSCARRSANKRIDIALQTCMANCQPSRQPNRQPRSRRLSRPSQMRQRRRPLQRPRRRQPLRLRRFPTRQRRRPFHCHAIPDRYGCPHSRQYAGAAADAGRRLNPLRRQPDFGGMDCSACHVFGRVSQPEGSRAG